MTTGSNSGCQNHSIYNGFNVLDNFQHTFNVSAANNVTHMTRDLNIDSAQLADAGEYLCAEQRTGAGIEDTSSAQLIVLGKHIDAHNVVK